MWPELEMFTMAKVKQTVKTKTYRVRKTGGNSGYKKCNMCNGTGRVKTKK